MRSFFFFFTFFYPDSDECSGSLLHLFPLSPITPEARGASCTETLDRSEILSQLPVCLHVYPGCCQCVKLSVLTYLHASSLTWQTMPIGLIVIPLARFPSFSSLPPIPVLAAPVGCVTAQLIYL